jgi:hypothetical protein
VVDVPVPVLALLPVPLLPADAVPVLAVVAAVVVAVPAAAVLPEALPAWALTTAWVSACSRLANRVTPCPTAFEPEPAESPPEAPRRLPVRYEPRYAGLAV